MSDEEKVQPVPLGEQTDPEVLLYDFSKFMTTLALLLLGGVLTLTTAEGDSRLSRDQIIIIIGFLTMGGVFAFSCADMIVRHRLKGQARSRWLKWSQYGAVGGISLGTGQFLAAWLDLIP